ncbi:MAG: RNA polymerase sigma factor [bacterium]
MASPEREDFLEELQRHLDALYSYAWWMTGGNEEAEDIVHDAVARAIANWEQFAPGTSMKAWLFTILRRTHLNRLRRSKIEVTSAGYPEKDELLPADPKSANPGRLPARLVGRDIDAALAALSGDQRSIVLLADVEGLTLREIAEIEDIPVGTVKSRLWRARSDLRAILKDYKEGPE